MDECPLGDISKKDLGNLDTEYIARDLKSVLEVLATFDHNPAGYLAACAKIGIKPIVHLF